MEELCDPIPPESWESVAGLPVKRIKVGPKRKAIALWQNLQT